MRLTIQVSEPATYPLLRSYRNESYFKPISLYPLAGKNKGHLPVSSGSRYSGPVKEIKGSNRT